MPKEQHNLKGDIIANQANQTPKEIVIQLDNKGKKEEDKYNKLESEFIRNGNRHRENEHIEIWARLKEEHIRDAKRYIL